MNTVVVGRKVGLVEHFALISIQRQFITYVRVVAMEIRRKGRGKGTFLKK